VPFLRLASLSVSQADNEGSIPFTRSAIFKASSLPRFNLVSVKVSVSDFLRFHTIANRHQRVDHHQLALDHSRPAGESPRHYLHATLDAELPYPRFAQLKHDALFPPAFFMLYCTNKQ
jgi:hypothetical protein